MGSPYDISIKQHLKYYIIGFVISWACFSFKIPVYTLDLLLILLIAIPFYILTFIFYPFIYILKDALTCSIRKKKYGNDNE